MKPRILALNEQTENWAMAMERCGGKDQKKIRTDSTKAKGEISRSKASNTDPRGSKWRSRKDPGLISSQGYTKIYNYT